MGCGCGRSALRPTTGDAARYGIREVFAPREQTIPSQLPNTISNTGAAGAMPSQLPARPTALESIGIFNQPRFAEPGHILVTIYR